MPSSRPIPVAPALLIRLKKERDGGVVQTCTRADGSATWQRLPAGKSAFFPLHDLTHYAVETVMGHKLGFYGLLASGWGFTDFDSSWPKGRIPADADPSELIVGFLDAERASGVPWSAAELNAHAARFDEQLGARGAPDFTDDQLHRVRARLIELTDQWDAVKPGEALELPFDVP